MNRRNLLTAAVALAAVAAVPAIAAAGPPPAEFADVWFKPKLGDRFADAMKFSDPTAPAVLRRCDTILLTEQDRKGLLDWDLMRQWWASL